MWAVGEFSVNITNSEYERLNSLSTCLLCDAMAELDILEGGVLSSNIKPIFITKKLIGVAYTVKAPFGNSFPVHYAIYNARKGYVLVVDTEQYSQGPYLGELMVLTAKNMGLNGLIIDGYVRDYEELIKIDFPIFAKGCIPTKPGKKREGSVNCPISCGNICINPGDVIVCDSDGILSIPRQYLDIILYKAEIKKATDDLRKEKIEDFFKDNLYNNLNKDISILMPKDIKDNL